MEPRTTASTVTALTHVRVLDGERLREPATVVIDGPLIGTDPAGARVVGCQGATLLPGLIDAHVHVRDAETLDRLADHGVTTALDMGGWPPALLDSLRDLPGTAALLRGAGPGRRARQPPVTHAALPREQPARRARGRAGLRRRAGGAGRGLRQDHRRGAGSTRGALPGRWRSWSAPPAGGGCARRPSPPPRPPSPPPAGPGWTRSPMCRWTRSCPARRPN
ncbi:hypothetical protein [Streptomyces albidoflavus]|uniref:hypothetical protein n=1 Tax=Streptomyces albidoflavus TaxID=1886 RepID=UPI004041EB8B